MKNPSISVIIPIYNVAEYLEETLQAIANQSFSDYEVIMVDDGSSDESAVIADRYCSGDSRFGLIRKKNEGVSIARNTGIEHASGKYLLLIDADDPIPFYALEELFRAAEDSDADIVTGKLMHLTEDGYTTVRMSEIVFSEYQAHTTLEGSPKLVYDSITCGKLIRKAYWDRLGLEFPSHLSYCEDMPVAFRLYSNTEKITMLDKVVYYWRVRAGNKRSATQKKDLKMIEQRLTSLRMINRYINERGISEAINREKKIKSLMMDFNILVNKIVDMDNDIMIEAMEMIGNYMKEDGLPSEFGKIPVLYAEKYKAMLKRDCGRLRKLRAFQTDKESCIKVRKCGNLIIGLFPGDIIRFGVADMRSTIDRELLRQRVRSVDISDRSIEIEGCAYIRYLPVRTPNDVKMEAWIKDEERNKIRQIDLEQITTKLPFAREKKVNSNRVAYAGTGYKIKLKNEDILNLKHGEYRLFIEWYAAGKRGESTVFPFMEDVVDEINKSGFLKEGVAVKTTVRREPVLIV